LEDPDYHGPGAGSWSGITVEALGDTTVRFTLATPIGGFLDLATQPIVPQHLLAAAGAAGMADDPFGREPIGSGPYAVIELDRDHAVLVPADEVGPAPEPSTAASPSTEPLATLGPTRPP